MKRRLCPICKTHKINVYAERAGIYETENQYIFCYMCIEPYPINMECYADLKYKDLKNTYHNDKVINMI
jgi:hypothetical protein